MNNITKIFKSYEDFLLREDKSVNGVSATFAEENPNYKIDNNSNEGCWECIQCYECIRCINCFFCLGCIGGNYLLFCNHCIQCEYCKHCVRCENCTECLYCSYFDDGNFVQYNTVLRD